MLPKSVEVHPATHVQVTPEAQCVIIVPSNATSPLGKYEEVQWTEVMQHVAKRLANINPAFRAQVFTDADLQVGKFSKHSGQG